MLKSVSSIVNAIGALNYKGAWNASTNSPALASGTGVKGDYYVVSTGGSTSLNGTKNWGVGDWVVFNGSEWQRVVGGANVDGVTLAATPRDGAAPTSNSLVNGLNIFNGQGGVTGDGVSIVLDHSFGTPGSQTRGVYVRSFSDTVWGGDVSCVIGTTSSGTWADRVVIGPGSTFAPATDNNIQLGFGTRRWSAVYAGTGTINTSDEREKQNILELDAAEKRVAIKLKGLVKKFRFRDAVQAKGNDARIHVGVIAQEVVAAFHDEGLDPMCYAMVCYDQWDAALDEDGNEIPEGQPIPDDATPGEIVTESIPGNRTHWGLIAQEVKAVVDAAGVDFAGWTMDDPSNPDSRQGLRYDQFIAPLIKAVQELSAEVQILKSKLPE